MAIKLLIYIYIILLDIVVNRCWEDATSHMRTVFRILHQSNDKEFASALSHSMTKQMKCHVRRSDRHPCSLIRSFAIMRETAWVLAVGYHCRLVGLSSCAGLGPWVLAVGYHCRLVGLSSCAGLAESSRGVICFCRFCHALVHLKQ